MKHETVLTQIDSVLSDYEKLWGLILEEMGDHEYSWAPSEESVRLVATLRNALHNAAPPGSTYHDDTRRVMSTHAQYEAERIPQLKGLLEAVRADYAEERLGNALELIHADLFSDMLEGANYLLGENWTAAAAVMARAVLEQHLRELCRKHGIPTEVKKPNGKIRKLMIEDMNRELRRKDIYANNTLKDVTAWADVGNAAAHGESDRYKKENVALMLQGIGTFIKQFPA